MRPVDYARLVSLAAIWGAAFIFTRSIVPTFGAIPTAATRVLLGGGILLGFFAMTRLSIPWRGNMRHLLFIGIVNCAIPFSLYAFAALHLPGSYLAIFNATSSLFGAALSAVFLAERLSRPKVLGLGLGIAGVALVAGAGSADSDSMFEVSVLACLCAAMCYGIGSTYVRRFTSHIQPQAIAASSQIVAGLSLLPLFVVDAPSTSIHASTAVDLLALAVLCSAVAYLLYYRLIADVGPSKALTVTFLIPAFAMLWGAVFLDERITATMVLGTLVVVGGTLLVTRSRPGRAAELATAVSSVPEAT